MDRDIRRNTSFKRLYWGMGRGISAGIIVVVIVMILATIIFNPNAQGLQSLFNSTKGSLIGNSFEINFYDHFGNNTLTTYGQKVNMDSNITKNINGDYEMSSVITITIDGHEIETCGDTTIFAETGLTPDVDFILENIESTTNGSITENTSIASVVNQFRNYYGKPRVVVVCSQLGVPICAFSGDEVFYDVCDDLPKTTKVMIDGKALYIHRATFKIIDLELIN